jgi:protein-tyrosine phosphatase
MADAGYTHLTCSPHIWPERVYSAHFIVDRVQSLQRELDSHAVPITLIPGGELNLLDLDIFSLLDEQIISYNMAGKYVLFDFWADELPEDYWERIERVKQTGAVPVQAHPERIACFQYHPMLLDELAEQGVLLQCNLQCLSDRAGVRTRDCAEQWLSDHRYFLLASDAHRTDTLGIRLRGLEKAIELLGMDEVDRLTIANPAKVVGLDSESRP